MTTAMGLGLGIGLLVALLIWFIFNKTKKTPKYDERQVAARGRAYKAGLHCSSFDIRSYRNRYEVLLSVQRKTEHPACH